MSAPTYYGNVVGGYGTFSSLTSQGAIVAAASITAGGAIQAGYGGIAGSSLIYSGTGVPSISATNGSIFLSYSNGLYVNTSGAGTVGTTWSQASTGSTGVTGLTTSGAIFTPLSGATGAVTISAPYAVDTLNNQAIGGVKTFSTGIAVTGSASITSSFGIVPGYNGNNGTATIYSGSGVPAFSATEGSIFLSSNGNAYINASGSTTWTAFGTSTSGVSSITTSGAIFTALAGATGAVTIAAPNAVDTTSTQTIGGVKTFSGAVAVASLTSNGEILPGLSGTAGTAGIYSGSGSPSISANQGSLFLSSNGSAYVNTSSGSGTTWTLLQSGSGAVTGVTATSPLSSTGGAAPVISIASSPTFAGTVTANQFTGSGAGLTAGTVPNAALVTTPIDTSGTAQAKSGNLTVANLSSTQALSAGTGITAGGSLGVTGSATIGGSLSVSGAISALTTLSAAGATTLAGTTFTAGSVSFTNATSNFILFPSAGVGPPTYTTRSAGTRLVLYPDTSSSMNDFALGIDSGTLWYAVPPTCSFKWYVGTSVMATMDNVGDLTLAGNLTSQTLFNVLTYGADPTGVANSSTAIQNALTAAANKGTVYIPQGTYAINGALVVSSNTSVQIEGTLRVVNGTNSPIFQLPSVSNVRIWGTGTLDCNGNNQSTTNNYAMSIVDSKNVVVEGITVLNPYYFSINPVGCTNVTIRDVKVDSTLCSTGTGLGFSGDQGSGTPSTNCWIERCTITNTHDEAVSFYGQCINCGVRDSYISGAVYGIGILNDSGQAPAANGIIIENNSITGCTYPPILVQTNAGGTGTHSNIIIRGNHIYSNPANSMYFNNCSGVIVSNNICHTNNNGAYLVASTVSHVIFTGNIMYNEGQNGGGGLGGYGVYFYGAAPYVSVTGNRFYDNQGTPTMAVVLYGTSGTNLLFTGNAWNGLITDGTGTN